MLIEKSRSGVYQDTPENRRLHRVGQRYGKVVQKEEDFESFADRYEKEYRKKHSGSPVKNSEIRYEASKAWDKMHSSENSRLHHVDQKYGGAKKDETKLPSKLGGLEFNEDKSTGERWYEGEMGGQRVRILQETVGKDDWWVVEISGHNVVDDNNKAMTFDNVQDAFEAIKQAEKIDRGVRAAEKKRHLEEIKRTNEKINAAMKKQFITEKKSAEMVEKPTSRVTFADVPRSREVNLKKYLTDSRRKDVDRLMQTVDGMSSSAIKQAHDAAVKKFNDNFDNMKKSERASALYVIMKYKDLMNKVK